MNPTRTSFIKRLGDERGVALPVALAVLFSVAGLATVAGRSAIVTSHQSQRDRNVKSAIQAAQSGLEAAIYQTNMLQPASNQCVVKDATTGALSNAAVQADGYCNPTTETMGDNASYSVRVSQGTNVTVNGQALVRREVVSTGTANGVPRRATVTIDAATGVSLFPAGYAMISRESVEFKNNANIVNGGIGSNGDITFKNNADVCGHVTPGPGRTADVGNNFDQCPGYNTNPATQPFPFPPVDMSGPNASNDNGRLTSLNSPGADTCTSCSNVIWNSGTRVLTIQNGGVLTLSGNVYSVCRLDIQNGGQLKIAARTTPLYFYVDTPATCGGGSGMGSVVLDGKVINANTNPATFALMVAGSTTTSTSVDISSNITAAEAPMAIYAPNSTVDYKNNLDWKGALMAKTIKVKNNADIEYDTRISELTLASSLRFYEPYGYKECSSDPPSSTPNSGC